MLQQTPLKGFLMCGLASAHSRGKGMRMYNVVAKVSSCVYTICLPSCCGHYAGAVRAAEGS